MDRRRFLLTSLGRTLAAPLGAEAQQAGTGARIGQVTLSPLSAAPASHAAFRDELRQLGYVEGRNLTIEHRSVNGRRELVQQAAGELAALGVELIVATDTEMAEQIVAATTRIPIVVLNGGDYVGTGLAATLAKPGGRVTGLAFMVADLAGKRLELLAAAVPGLRRVVVVLLKTSQPQFLTATQREIEQAATRVRPSVSVAMVDGLADLERQITSMAAENRTGMLLVEEPPWWPHRARIGELTLRHRVPAVYALRGFAEAGVLMSYGPDVLYFFRRTAHYVDKILQGGQAWRPADRAADKIRVGHQPQDRQGSRPHDPAVAAGAGGSGDRVMDRRRFLLTSLAGALAAPLAPTNARAQVSKSVYRIGILSPGPDPYRTDPIIAALHERGWVVGRNLLVEFRHTQGDPQRAEALAAELVDARVDVIVTDVTATAMAARRATSTVPIVMLTSGFPVEGGLAKSLARPGGNVTGMTAYAGGGALFGKYVQLLHETCAVSAGVGGLLGLCAPRLQDGATSTSHR